MRTYGSTAIAKAAAIDAIEFIAPAGQIRLSARGVINDKGKPEAVFADAQQHAVEDFPDNAMVFLLGTCYCETERLSEIARSLFGTTPLGWGRVQAICVMCASTSSSAMSTHALAARSGKPTATAPVSAANTRISLLRSADA